MSKKHTTDMAGPYLARVAARRAAIVQAEKDLNTVIGEGVAELGPTFRHEDQEYAIRFYTKTGKYALCEYELPPGAHLKPRRSKGDLAEIEDLRLPEDGNLIEVELTVGENLLNDPVYGPPDVAPSTETNMTVVV